MSAVLFSPQVTDLRIVAVKYSVAKEVSKESSYWLEIAWWRHCLTSINDSLHSITMSDVAAE